MDHYDKLDAMMQQVNSKLLPGILKMLKESNIPVVSHSPGTLDVDAEIVLEKKDGVDYHFQVGPYGVGLNSLETEGLRHVALGLIESIAKAKKIYKV